ncbi:hypothetical protein Tco_1419306 [Tanacetum coccineum]
MVDDEGNFNPAKDLEEHERLLAKEPQSNVTEIQGYNTKETKFDVTSTRNYVVMLLLLQQLRRNQHTARKHRKPDSLDAIQVVGKVACDVGYCLRKQT